MPLLPLWIQLGVLMPAHLFSPICFPQGLPSRDRCSATRLQPQWLDGGLFCPTWSLGNGLAGTSGPGLHRVAMRQDMSVGPRAPADHPGQPSLGIAPGGDPGPRSVRMMGRTLSGWRVPPAVNLDVAQSGGTFQKN